MRLQNTLGKAAALLMIFAFSARAQNVVDQSSSTYDTPFSQDFYWAVQRFTPTASTITGAGFVLENQNSTYVNNNVFFFLFDRLPSDPSAQVIRSNLVSATYAPGQTAWLDAFWSPLAITSGAPLFMAVMSYNFTALADDTNPYQGGEAYRNYSNATFLPYDEFAGYDLAFRTYTDQVVATPEPATLLLLASGLAGVGIVSRKRRS